MNHKKKISIMLMAILTIQIILPTLTVIFENSFSLKALATNTVETKTETITDEFGNTITWTYSIEAGYAVNIKPKDLSSLPSYVKIPEFLGSYIVKSIADNAFYDCDNFTTIDFSFAHDIESIGQNAFYGCDSLEEIEMPKDLQELGNKAFYSCDSLKIVYLNNYLKTIGSEAFAYCKELEQIDLKIDLEKIGDKVFSGCKKLKNIKVDENNTNYSSENGILFNKDKTELIHYPARKTDTNYTIPESVKSIADTAFQECTNLTKIEMPNSLTTIGNLAFFNCDSLTTIDLSNSLTTIEDRAFYGCDNLTTLTIPSSVTNIGTELFTNCPKLAKINVDENNSNYVSENGILFNKDKTQLIRYPAGKTDTEYTIPSSVEIIDIAAFSYSEKISKVVIPNGVTTLENNAFSYCYNLSKVIIPGSVTSIGNNQFNVANNLTIYCTSNSFAETYAKSNNIQYVIDDEAPTISKIKKDEENSTDTEITLIINAEDNLSGLAQEAYSFDDGKTWQSSNSTTYSINTENVVIKVRDNLGNITTKTINIEDFLEDTDIDDKNKELDETSPTGVNLLYGSGLFIAVIALITSIAFFKFKNK